MSIGRSGGFGTIALLIVGALLLFGDDPARDGAAPGPEAGRGGHQAPSAGPSDGGAKQKHGEGAKPKPGNAERRTGRARGRRAEVLRVVDGDTIQVDLDGKTEYVRFIGVDTPETVKPGTPVQCYGKKASAFNHELLDGRTVRLVFDSELRDIYDRLLAYVYTGPTFVNAELVRRGYARTLEIAPNTSKATMLRRLQAAAGRAGRGLWGAC